MKKELLETIDETIMSTCDWIKELLSNTNYNEQFVYPNASIMALKALAELISARASLKKETYSLSDSSKE